MSDTMNSHYIPRLLLKYFSESGKVNSYSFTAGGFSTKKLKNTFTEEDIFDPELEAAFAEKLEGPFGDLLHHKLINNDEITINRKENLLIRKFLMVNALRSPITNGSWDEIIERTQLKNHPSVLMSRIFEKAFPEYRTFMKDGLPSKDKYIVNLKKAMEIDSLEDLADDRKSPDISLMLQLAARYAVVTVIALWDCCDTGQEFILPKLPGISQMDQVSIFHKAVTISKILDEKKAAGEDGQIIGELQRLEMGSAIFSENFSIYPISPTRALIYFSPYFRSFFPVYDFSGKYEIYPPFLNKEQFDSCFFSPMRMELYRPCGNEYNRVYHYSVKKLTKEEILMINSLLLDMETEEFVFHDYNRVRDSFWYYDNMAKMAFKKKHDFSRLI